jgi:hypothetical protein
MMKTKTIVALLSCIIMAAGLASIVHAQATVSAPPGVEEQISVEINPQKPQPGDNVDLAIESFSFDMNKAYVVWAVNGVVKSEGPGKRKFSFTAGKAGTTQKITIGITTEDQRIINKTLTFAPARVGLVVEADTYTPPYYKGKALFTPQAMLKVVALPELVTSAGYKIPAENLVYTWSVDGKVMQDSSGYGKSALFVEGNLIPRSMVVTAAVSAYNSDLTAEESVQIEPSEPEIILYEDSLLWGVRREEAFTSDMYLYAREVKLLAEPYFLSVHIPESTDVQYTWTLNGQTVTSLNKPNLIGLENRTGESGIATLGLNIEHFKKLLQAPSLTLQVQFEKPE